MTAAIDTIARFVLGMLFNGLWEAALLALAAWIALRAMPAANATTRHTILAAALLASLVLPVVTTAIGMSHVVVPPQYVTASTQRIATHAPRVAARHSTERAQAAQPAVQKPALSIPAMQRLNVTVPPLLAIAVAALWLLGALYALTRLVVSLFYLEGLKHNAMPVPIEYRARLDRWTGSSRGGRDVRLCRSNEIVIPIAVGLFDAMILVPQHFLDELEPQDIDRIVLHELAHLRRADDWVNALERIAQAIFFFNPAIVWLVAQLDVEREVACDDWVLQQNDALPYAHCLARIVETTAWPHRAMSAPGAFVTRRAMSVRIERLLSKHRDVGVSAALAPTGLVMVGLIAVCIAAALVSPSFAYPLRSEAVATHWHASATTRPSEKRWAARATQERAQTIAVANAPAATAPAVSLARQPRAAAFATLAPRSPAPFATFHAQPAAPPSTAPSATLAEEAPPLHSTDVADEVASTDYVDDLAAAGYTGLSVDELVQLRSLDVTPDFIRSMQQAGLNHPSVRELIELKSMSVTPEFVRTMRSTFGDAVSIEDICTARAVGVSPEYVTQLSQVGVKNLTLHEATSMRAMGITPDYVRELAGAGYPNLTSEQLHTLRALGIDGEFVRRAAAHGFHNLTIKQLVELKTTGVLQ